MLNIENLPIDVCASAISYFLFGVAPSEKMKNKFELWFAGVSRGTSSSTCEDYVAS